MTVLREEGDELQGERVICLYRRRGEEILIPQTAKHRAVRLLIKGMPAIAKIEKTWEFRK